MEDGYRYLGSSEGGSTASDYLVSSATANSFTEALDLLVVSPQATGWAGVTSVSCRLVLLPGSAAPMALGMHVVGAVSYGTGPKNTITLSSLGENTICLAIQRELVTVNGSIVERQELVLPYPSGQESPDLCMARVGTLLLLGAEPPLSPRSR